jgi:hypothetical protein
MNHHHQFFTNPERAGAEGLTLSTTTILQHMAERGWDEQTLWKYAAPLKPISLTALEIEAIYWANVEALVRDKLEEAIDPDYIHPRMKELAAEEESLRKKGVFTVYDWFSPVGDACLNALLELEAVPKADPQTCN